MVAQRALTVVTNRGNIETPIASEAKVLALLINPYGDGAYTRTDAIRHAFETQNAVFAWRVLTGETPRASRRAS